MQLSQCQPECFSGLVPLNGMVHLSFHGRVHLSDHPPRPAAPRCNPLTTLSLDPLKLSSNPRASKPGLPTRISASITAPASSLHGEIEKEVRKLRLGGGVWGGGGLGPASGGEVCNEGTCALDPLRREIHSQGVLHSLAFAPGFVSLVRSVNLVRMNTVCHNCGLLRQAWASHHDGFVLVQQASAGATVRRHSLQIPQFKFICRSFLLGTMRGNDDPVSRQACALNPLAGTFLPPCALVMVNWKSEPSCLKIRAMATSA